MIDYRVYSQEVSMVGVLGVLGRIESSRVPSALDGCFIC